MPEAGGYKTQIVLEVFVEGARFKGGFKTFSLRFNEEVKFYMYTATGKVLK
jgi:hypothetical protein